MFKRGLSTDIIIKLKKESLFIKCLLPDIIKGDVFPAIRNEYVDFYYKGGLLFKYDGKDFYTHIKYASVIYHDRNYISQNQLATIKHIFDFIKAYKRIKENCSLYSGIERASVWELHKKYSYIKNPEIMVLDIEVSFLRKDKNKEKEGRDQIDLLIFNKKTKTLRFYEAKHFSNSEIWAKVCNAPKVKNQIKRYNLQIEKNRDAIIQQYSNYIDVLNQLFELNLEKPIKIENNAILLIFGFDNDQLKGRFAKLIKENPSFSEIKYYPIGNIKGLKITNMWTRLK